MTERDKHIEMAQRLGLVGMRPHLDGIYIDALAAFAKLVADDARATPALPQGDEYKHAKCPGHDAYAASQALPQGVEEWIAANSCAAGLFEPRTPCIGTRSVSAYLSGMAIVPVEPDLKHHNSLESMILSHTDVWRELLLTEKRESRRDHQEKYWQHEIDALDSIVSALRLAILAAVKEPATCSVCGLKRSDTKNCKAPDCSPMREKE